MGYEDKMSEADFRNICESGNLVALNSILNSVHPYKKTLIHAAAKYGNVEIMDTIIKFGININERNYAYATPLIIASEYGNINVVEYLLNHGAWCNEHDSGWDQGYHAKTALMYACENDHIEIVKMLLKRRCNINAISSLRLSAIDYASSVEIIELLIKHGAHINHHQYVNGIPILSRACKKGRIDIIDCLLSNNIDVNYVRDMIWGNTALFYACKYSQVDAVDRLLANEQIDIHIKNHRGETAFMYAVKSDSVPIMDRIILYGAEINDQNCEGDTPLIIAVREMRYKAIERLMSLNCDVDIQNNKGETALLIAFKSDNIKITNILLSHDVDKDKKF